MFLRLLIFNIAIVITSISSRAQSIVNSDGSPLTTKFCHADTNHAVAGQPSGGSFSGCGVFQQNGQWYFNPIVATTGVTVFPYQCQLDYTMIGNTVHKNMLVYKPVVIFPSIPDAENCSGDFVFKASTLYAGDYDYVWTPGVYLADPNNENTTGHIDGIETFVVTATDVTSGCAGSDTFTLSVNSTPALTVSNDTSVIAGEKIQLHASGADQYAWTPREWLDDPLSSDPWAQPQASVTYSVTGTNAGGCADTADVCIELIEKLTVPNAFTPNGDGLNDVFKINRIGYQKLLYFMIFNRWGEKVFVAFNGSQGWDGSYKGASALPGTYYYFIQVMDGNGVKRTLKGDVVLVR
jgi:gliding motility-associated-like protein